MRELLVGSRRGGVGGLFAGHLLLYLAGGVAAVAVLLVVIAALLHRRQNGADWAAPGLYGVVGRMGGGKSYLLCWVGVQSLRRGRPVFANFDLVGSTRVRCWSDVLAIGAGDPADSSTWPVVLLDEIHLWWGRDQYRAPVEVMAWASQLRKAKTLALYASQHEGFVSTRLLRLTFAFWTCVRYRAGHQYTLYDGQTFASVAKRERMSRMYVKRSPEVMAAYDTNEIVSASVEWGDGQGFENLRLAPRVPPAADRTGPAERSDGPSGRLWRPAERGALPGSEVLLGKASMGASVEPG